MNDLPEVRECLIQILQALPGQPQRLRLSAGEVSVELEWPPEPLPAAANGAVAANDAAPAPDAVCSPSVGTFYRSPEPGAPPFVAEGDVVRSGQQVAIIEAMKLMLPVEADKTGRVTKILKADGEPVEYGVPLMELAAVGESDKG